MSGSTTIFGDGVLDVHIASGVARITLGTASSQRDGKPTASGMLLVPVGQLAVFARVFAEVTRQVEQRAAQAASQAAGSAPPQPGDPPGPSDQVAGAFRFGG